MNTMVDTLKIYERLKSADLNDKAAKEIAEVFKETIDEQLATKRDIEILRTDLEKLRIELTMEIQKSKTETIKWVAGMLVAQAAIVATLVKLL
ncbi:MAG: hypothetical protein Q8M34_06760 [Thermodesulfovibrionales bacterium]|nr:hypothetical protein [Thermodesulfovibrionales bacterium]